MSQGEMMNGLERSNDSLNDGKEERPYLLSRESNQILWLVVPSSNNDRICNYLAAWKQSRTVIGTE